MIDYSNQESVQDKHFEAEDLKIRQTMQTKITELTTSTRPVSPKFR